MNRLRDQKGSSLIEVIAALIIFSLAAVGLAIAIPLSSHGRLTIWQGQFDLGGLSGETIRRCAQQCFC